MLFGIRGKGITFWPLDLVPTIWELLIYTLYIITIFILYRQLYMLMSLLNFEPSSQLPSKLLSNIVSSLGVYCLDMIGLLFQMSIYKILHTVPIVGFIWSVLFSCPIRKIGIMVKKNTLLLRVESRLPESSVQSPCSSLGNEWNIIINSKSQLR